MDESAPLDGAAGERSRFLRAFDGAIHGLPDPLTVLYSGGLDSSFVAFRAAQGGRSVRLSVIGTPGAPDLATAESGARLLGLSLTVRQLDDPMIRSVLDDPALELHRVPEPFRSVRVAFALAISAAPGVDLVCGQGADELFGGYAHFRGLTLEEAVRRREADLARALGVEWQWALSYAETLGRRLYAPFLDPSVCAAAFAVPARASLTTEPPKRWLRDAARSVGLPELLADRPKRALQYGSGVRRRLPVPSPPTDEAD